MIVDPTREIIGLGVVLDDDSIERLFAETPGGVCPPPFQHPAGLCLTQHDGEA